jgi:hypothetical protein
MRALLALNLLAAANGVSYPPQDYQLVKTQASPKHTFLVEIYQKHIESEFTPCVWLVTPDRSRAELLVPSDALTPLYPVTISVSPDEQWILREQKLYHGADAYSLYERSGELHYKVIGPQIFSEQAWRFMSEQTHRKFKTDYIHIMRVSDWPTRGGSRVRQLALTGGPELTPATAPNDHSLAISLDGDDQKSSVNLWLCFYDLDQHRFYLDAALQKHNRGRVVRSRQK